MNHDQQEVAAAAAPAYAALRFGGASPARARTELALEPLVAARLEAGFGRWPGRWMRPRFARHAAHVAGVRAAGGFPVLGQ